MNITLIKFLIYTIIIFALSLFLYQIPDIPILKYDQNFTRMIIIIFIMMILTQIRFKKFEQWLVKTFNKNEVITHNTLKLLNQKLNKTYTFNNFMLKLRDAFSQLDLDEKPLLYFHEEKICLYRQETYDIKLDINWDEYFSKEIENPFDQIEYITIDDAIRNELKKLPIYDHLKTLRLNKMILLETGSIVIGAAFIPQRLFQLTKSDQIANIMNRLFLKIPNIYNRSKLLDETQQTLKERQFMIQLGKDISSSLSLKKVLTTLLNELKQIVEYNAAGIFLLTNDGSEFEELITVGYEQKRVKEFLVKSHQGISSKVIQNAETVYIPNIKEDENYFEARAATKSQVTIPIVEDETVIGAFTLESDNYDSYSEKTINLLEVISKQASIAIVNARLFEDSRRKNQLEKEMLNASEIQKALIPKRAPSVKGFDVKLFSKPCEFVAGDIIDVIKLKNDEFMFAIGDVSGKGPPASILMAVLFSGLRSQLDFNYQVSEHNARLNNLLFDTTSSMYYSTYFLATINSETKKLKYSNAGHTPPFILSKNNEVQYLKKGGMVLGFLENQIYTQGEVQLKKDDILVMFTDGLDEAFDLEEEEFGVDRVLSVVKEYKDQPTSIIMNKILEKVKDFHGVDKKFEDDITLMIIKVN